MVLFRYAGTERPHPGRRQCEALERGGAERRQWRIKRGGSLVSKGGCRPAGKAGDYCEPDRAQRDGVRLPYAPQENLADQSLQGFFSCSFFSRSEYADTAQLPLVYYSRVFFCRVRSLPSVSAGPYTPGEYSANSTINNTVQPCNRLWRLHCNSMSGLKIDFSACRHRHGSRR